MWRETLTIEQKQLIENCELYAKGQPPGPPIDDLVHVITHMANLLDAHTTPQPTYEVPTIGQCDKPHRDHRYNGSGTVCRYGCLIISLYALAIYAGYRPQDDTNPVVEFCQKLKTAGAFEGDYLNHPSRIRNVCPSLRWRYDHWLIGERSRESSLVHWRSRPADIKLLTSILAHQPVVAEVDYTPHVTTDENWHFVLILRYTPPTNTIDDDCLIMDPVTGEQESLTQRYFREAWLRDGTMADGRTRVQRTLTGLRAWEVVNA